MKQIPEKKANEQIAALPSWALVLMAPILVATGFPASVKAVKTGELLIDSLDSVGVVGTFVGFRWVFYLCMLSLTAAFGFYSLDTAKECLQEIRKRYFPL